VVDAAVKARRRPDEHGKPAVVVVSFAEYENYGQAGQRKPSFIEHLLSVPQGGEPLGGCASSAQREILMYLTDTVAFAELFKRRRHPGFLSWLSDKSEDLCSSRP